MTTARGALLEVVADSTDYGTSLFKGAVSSGQAVLVVVDGAKTTVFSLNSNDAAISDLVKTEIASKDFSGE
jgi:hypothetical protein